MSDVTYVFDTEPLLGYIYDEPGYGTVADRIDAVHAGETIAAMADSIAAEVCYKVARYQGDSDRPTPESLRMADRDVRALERMGITIERADWRLAGQIKAHGGLSLADAFAVALAVEHDATLLVGGDADFDALPVEVEIERIRDEGV